MEQAEFLCSVAKKMEQNIIDKFEEGLSTASRGFSWAEDLWENICQNNSIVQEPAKIVDAVNLQVRKIYEEIADDWFNPFSLGSDGAPTSDLSLKEDLTTDCCEKSMTTHDKEPLSEVSLIFPNSGLAIAPKEIGTVPLSDIEKEGGKEAHDLFSLGYDEALVSDLSLEQDATADVCEESKASHFDGSICECSDSCISPVPALAIAFLLSDKEKKQACVFVDKEIALTPPEASLCSCSSEINTSDEISSSFTSISLSGSVPASDNICPPTGHSGSLPTSDSICLSDLSLVQDVKADTCEASRARQDKELIGETSSTCSLSALAIASEHIAVVSLQHIEKDERTEACELFDKDIFQTPESHIRGSSSEIRHANVDILDLSAYPGHVASLPAADNIYQLHENRVESELMRPHFGDPTEDGISDGGNGHKVQHSITVDKLECIEEFEDVSLEDFVVDEKTLDEEELVLISQRVMKNCSYKKKLRDAFTSRFFSSKKNKEWGASFSGDLGADLTEKGIRSPSLVSSRVSEASNMLTLESPESDWELL